jgi:hypothetical protein
MASRLLDSLRGGGLADRLSLGITCGIAFQGSDLPTRILKSGYERSCWLSQAWHTFISGIIRYSSAPLFHSQWQHGVNSAHNHHFADNDYR